MRAFAPLLKAYSAPYPLTTAYCVRSPLQTENSIPALGWIIYTVLAALWMAYSTACAACG